MNNGDLLFLTCLPRAVQPLVEKLTAHLEENYYAARVVKHGLLVKGREGFVLLACPSDKDFAPRFYDVLRQEEDVTGYVLLPRESGFRSRSDGGAR